MRTGAVSTIPKAVLCALLLPLSLALAQVPPGVPPTVPATQQAPPQLSPDQLDNLVAPVALYPDPLLGQVLAASTYPLEIVEVQQWLQQNRNLQGAQLLDAAKQQNWDPSVQALVAFPDALNLLSNDIRWATDLGNAFLAQQADVMSAIQRMRARASANGRLRSTPQQVVTNESQDGQSAIEIQPADPQVIYVPVYQPEYVWGPPAWGAYPDLWYPPGYGFGFGFGFGPGIFIGGLFPGWGGWGGWGWGCGWFGRSLFVNSGFFHRYGFRGGFGERGFRGFEGRTAWAHDPGHRMGVRYPNQAVAGRFNAGGRSNGGGFNAVGRYGGQFAGARSNGGQSNRGFASGGFANAGANGYRSFGGANRSATQGYRAPAQGFRSGYNSPSAYRGGTSYNRSFAPAYSARGQSYSAPRSYSMPRQSFSAPRPSFSAPRFSGGRSSFSGARGGFSSGHSGFSGGSRSFGGSGGHSGGGGGGHSGGGGGGHRR